MSTRSFGNIPLSVQAYLRDRGISIEDYNREQHEKKLRNLTRANNQKILKSYVKAMPALKKWRQRASEKAYAPGSRGYNKAKLHFEKLAKTRRIRTRAKTSRSRTRAITRAITRRVRTS